MTARVRTTRKARSWRRRLVSLAVILAGLLLAFRIALPFALPSVLDALVADLGLTLRYERLDLSLLRGDVQLWNVDLSRRLAEGAVPAAEDRVAHLEYAHVNLDLVTLPGIPLVRRASVEGLDLWAEDEGDGNLSLPFGGSVEAEGNQAVVAADTAPDAAVDFSPPVRVVSADLQHLRLHVRDAGGEDRWIEANLRLAALGTGDEPARVSLRVNSPDILDSLAIDVRASLAEDHVEATLDLDVRGLRAANAARWLRALGIEPRAGLLTAALHGTLRARAATTPGNVDLETELSGMRVTADGVEQVAVDDARMHAELGRDTLLSEVIVRGVRGMATLRADGKLGVAGLDLVATPSGDAPATEPAKAAGEPGGLRVGVASVTGLDLRLRDEGVAPPVDLELAGGSVELRGLDTDPAAAGAGTLTLRGRSPGILDALAVDATLNPFGSTRRADLQIGLDGITLQRLTPYLEAMQLEPTLQDGQLRLRVTAEVEAGASGTRAAATLQGLSLVDGEPLLEIDRIRFGEVFTEADRTRVDGVEVDGIRISARRDGEGSMHGLGLRTIQTEMLARVGQAAGALESAARQEAEGTRRFELGSLRADGVALHLQDDLLDSSLAVENLEMALSDLAFGGRADPGAGPQEGQLSVRLDGALAEQIRLDGSFSTRPGPLDMTALLSLDAEGLRPAALASQLEALGIETTFTGGNVAATIRGHARLNAAAELELEAGLSEVAVTDRDGTEVLGFEDLSVGTATFGAGGLRVQDVSLQAPEVSVVRQADGRLRVAGLVLGAGTGPGPDRGGPAAAAAGEPTSVAIDRIALDRAVLRWRDEALSPAVDAGFTVDADVSGLTTGTGAGATPISLDVRRLDDDAHLRVEGAVTLDPQDLRGELSVDARGLRPGPLLPYVPAGVTMTLQDGRFHAELAASLAQNAVGGRSGELTARNLLLQDGETGPPLLQCEAVQVLAPRLDGEARVYEISEAVVQGLTLTAERTSPTALSLLGLTMDGAATRAVATVAGDVESEVSAAEASGAKSAEPAPPRIALGKLDLELERLTISESGSTEPLELRLRLTSREPMVLSDPEPENLVSVLLDLEGSASPLVDRIAMDWELLPWLAQSRGVMNWQLSGIKGANLVNAFPSLASVVSAEGIRDGQLRGKLTLRTEESQRTTSGFDLAQGFALELQLEGLELLAEPEGERLAGIGELLAIAPRITPESADLSTVDINDIHARIRRDEDGLHVAGLTLHAAGAGPADASAHAATPARPAGKPFEWAIAQLTASGLDFEFRDTTSDPELLIPLDGLALEVDDFTNRAFTEREAVRFSLDLEGGDVPVPVRSRSSGLISGIWSTATGLVGAAGEKQMQLRPLVEEISVRGELVLYPVPMGRVHTSLTQLELTALRGPATEAGVVISDGVVDAGFDIQFAGADGVFTDATVTFGHLALDDSANGLIASYLGLPASTNTVIFMLKDDADEIVIPMSFHIDDQGVAGGAIAREAINAFRAVVTDAVLASPYRVTGVATDTVTDVLGGLGSLFGIGGAEPAPPPPPAQVEFAPGNPALTAAATETLDRVAALLRDDEGITAVLQHELGPADLERARLLANPTPAHTRELVTQLRQRRAELAGARARVAADARAHHAVGRTEAAARATERLQAIDRDLGETENRLDEALQLLRPDAERRAERRTVETALELGSERLEVVKRYLLEACGPEYGSRIDIRRARRRMVEPTAETGDEPLGRVTVTPKRRKL